MKEQWGIKGLYLEDKQDIYDEQLNNSVLWVNWCNGRKTIKMKKLNYITKHKDIENQISLINIKKEVYNNLKSCNLYCWKVSREYFLKKYCLNVSVGTIYSLQSFYLTFVKDENILCMPKMWPISFGTTCIYQCSWTWIFAPIWPSLIKWEVQKGLFLLVNLLTSAIASIDCIFTFRLLIRWSPSTWWCFCRNAACS